MVMANFLNDLEKDKKTELDNLEVRLRNILGTSSEIFTDHSIGHSLRVISIVDKILESKMDTFEELSDYEILCLASSCLLHDIGMMFNIKDSGVVNKRQIIAELAEKPLEVRKKHAISSANLIKLSAGLINGENPLTIDLNKTVFADIAKEIAWICEKHSGPVTDNDLTLIKKISGGKIRVGLILCLLRLGDELDRTWERVIINKLDLIAIPPDSKLHWYIHYYTKYLNINEGIITLGLRIPNLPGGVPSKLKAMIINKISSEIDLIKIPLQKNGIVISFDNNNITSELQENLQKPPPDVLELMVDVDDTKIRDKVIDVSNRDNWMSYWGFNGNPWSDRILGEGSELLIKTDSMNSIISRTLSVAQSQSGGLKLIIAERRAGKTTLHRVMKDVLESNGCKIFYIETLNTIRPILSGLDLYNFVITEAKKIAKSLSGDSETSLEKKEFNTIFENVKDENVVIFLDNLDRLKYKDEDERKIIKDFLKLLQNFTDNAQERWMVLLCIPIDWLEMLSEEPYRYLRPELGMKLEPFSNKETWDLISKRIEANGKDPDELITTDASDNIREVSMGLPGEILGKAEHIFCHAAESKVKKIDEVFVSNIFPMGLKTARARAAIKISKISPDLAKGMQLIYDFQRDVDRKKEDISPYFEILINSIQRIQAKKGGRFNLKFIDMEIPFSMYSGSLAIIFERIDERITMGSFENTHVTKYRLKKYVRSFLEGLEYDSINSKQFLNGFSHNPIRPPGKKLKTDEKKEVEIELEEGQISGPLLMESNLIDASNKINSPEHRINSSWEALKIAVTCISDELKLSEKQFNFFGKNKISIKRMEADVITLFYNELRSNRINIQSKPLYYFLSDQALSVAFLEQNGKTNRKLEPDTAYHSAQSIISEFFDILNRE